MGVAMVLDTPTWRASADWGARLGFDADRLTEINCRAVEFVRALASDSAAGPVEHVVDGIIGPRGDGYVVGTTMSPDEAADYHALQARAFADAGADMITGVTMTYVDEAIGVSRAARSAGVPVALSFTVETDGRLPSGEALDHAIGRVDAETDGTPVHYMVNCAHPTHFADQLTAGAPWLERVKGVRANASRSSHEELDAATELDRGDPADLAAWYSHLDSVLPDLRVVGGCCGTDHEHVAAIAAAVERSRSA